MNDLPVIGYLCYAQRRLGPQALLVARRKCMAKSCFRVKKRRILEIDQYFFAVVLSQTWGMLICGKCKLLSK